MHNGQSADFVLGADGFARIDAGLARNRFGSAGGLSSDGEHLWVTDLANARVVQFNGQPGVNGPRADLVIGQTSFDASEAGPDDLHLAIPTDDYQRSEFGDVYGSGGILAVADGANRVVVWNALPSSLGVPWDIVLGQSTSTGAGSGTSATSLNTPSGVWTDGQMLLVADTQNHRILLWNSIPTRNGAAADLVLGQSDFDTRESPSPPTERSMNSPSDVFYDGDRLYVADAENHRIMVWNALPTENHAPADVFIGQTSGSTGSSNAGGSTANAVGLAGPLEIAVAYGSLFVADAINVRVVVHTPVPTTSGEPADAVLGYADLVGARLADGDQSLAPRGVAVFGEFLFVSDSADGTGVARVLRYALQNLPR